MTDSGFVRHTYRPFDTRWLYWEGDTKLLEEKRADYIPARIFDGNRWLSAAQHLRRGGTDTSELLMGVYTSHPGSHLIERGDPTMFPAYLRDEGLGVEGDGIQRRPNLSGSSTSTT